MICLLIVVDLLMTIDRRMWHMQYDNEVVYFSTQRDLATRRRACLCVVRLDCAADD